MADYLDDSGLDGGAAAPAISAVAAQLAALSSQVQALVRSTNYSHDRSAKSAVIADGSCPSPLKACNQAEAQKRGTTCPDYRVYAPDPLVVDIDGNICYAPEDLEKWAGKRNLLNTDAAIERASAEMLRHLNQQKYLNLILNKVKSETAIDTAFKLNKPPRDVKCDVPNMIDGGCQKWSSPLIVSGLDEDALDKGLKEAIALRAKAEGIHGDSVFTGVGDAYTSDINPATLAYAGAYAWGVKADAFARRMGGEYRPVYLERVRRLPAIIEQVNESVYRNLVENGPKYTKLVTLTFDVAWPILMERRIGLKGLAAAAEATKSLNVDDAALGKMTAAAQWNLVLKSYMGTAASAST